MRISLVYAVRNKQTIKQLPSCTLFFASAQTNKEHNPLCHCSLRTWNKPIVLLTSSISPFTTACVILNSSKSRFSLQKSHCYHPLMSPSESNKPQIHFKEQRTRPIMSAIITKRKAALGVEAVCLEKPTSSTQHSPAKSSLSKLRSPPSPSKSSARPPRFWNLGQKFSILLESSPCQQDQRNIPTPDQHNLPTPSTSHPKSTESLQAAPEARSKSPFRRSLFGRDKRDGKKAFELLAEDPVHGVKSHRLGDGQKLYTSFPVPVLANQSSDRLCDYLANKSSDRLCDYVRNCS